MSAPEYSLPGIDAYKLESPEDAYWRARRPLCEDCGDACDQGHRLCEDCAREREEDR